jgi:hypothetical protein
MTPTTVLERARAWQPIGYLIARAIVYTASFVLGAIAVWYAGDPQPDWLPRAVAVAAFAAGPLALVNLSTRPK